MQAITWRESGGGTQARHHGGSRQLVKCALVAAAGGGDRTPRVGPLLPLGRNGTQMFHRGDSGRDHGHRCAGEERGNRLYRGRSSERSGGVARGATEEEGLCAVAGVGMLWECAWVGRGGGLWK